MYKEISDSEILTYIKQRRVREVTDFLMVISQSHSYP